MRRSRRAQRVLIGAVGSIAALVAGVGVTQAVSGSTEPTSAVAGAPTAPTEDAGSGSTSRVSRSAERPALSLAAENLADDTTAVAEKAEKAEAAAQKKRAEAERKRKAEQERQRLIDNAVEDPRGAARAMLADHGWGDAEFACLDDLWYGESHWNYRATNPSSGAYGIPQSLPGSKMASAGADWQTNPITQIKWGLGYIAERYGTPCGAQGFKSGNGFY